MPNIKRPSTFFEGAAITPVAVSNKMNMKQILPFRKAVAI